MRTTMFKIYEFIQILLLNIVQSIAFVTKSKKWDKFIALRKPQNFQNDLKKIAMKFHNLKLQNPATRLFWFHIASAGELEQAIPIALELQKGLNACFFLTYYSASAEPFLKNFPACIGTTGLPIDVMSAYKAALKILPVEKIFFVRYDIWPGLVLFAYKNNIELNLICATKEKTTSGFRAAVSQKWSFWLYKKFKNIFVVTKQDYNLFQKKLPHQNIILAGDSKWHRAQRRTELFRERLQKIGNSKDTFLQFFSSVQRFIQKDSLKCVVFGSPHEQEHEIALKCVSLPQIFVVYVPHEVSKKACTSLYAQIQAAGGEPCFYSEVIQQNESRALDSEMVLPESTNAIILDTVGHLAEIYALGQIAVVGGGFDGQIHNVLEAVSHDVPILIGPKFTRAPEVQILVLEHVALTFPEPNLLFQFIAQWVTLKGDMKQLQIMKENAFQLFKNIPNTNKIILDIFIQEIQHDKKTTHY